MDAGNGGGGCWHGRALKARTSGNFRLPVGAKSGGTGWDFGVRCRDADERFPTGVRCVCASARSHDDLNHADEPFE